MSVMAIQSINPADGRIIDSYRETTADEVREIIDRWLEPDHRYFKVRGDDHGVYILRYDTQADHWDMILFDSGRRDDTRLSST